MAIMAEVEAVLQINLLEAEYPHLHPVLELKWKK